MADELTTDELAAALAGMGRVMLRLARIVQAMAADTALHDQAFDLVADLERLTAAAHPRQAARVLRES